MKKKVYFVLKKILHFVIPFIPSKQYNYDIEQSHKKIEKIYEEKNLFEEHGIKNLKINLALDLDIVIPVYNSQKYLDRCLYSACNQQTKYNYRIIVIDDGSTDESMKIVEKYNKKFKNIIILKQKNYGAAISRNNGINISNAKYLTFLDSDDYMELDFVEKMLSNAYVSDADVCICGYNTILADTLRLVSSTKLKNITFNPKKDSDLLLKLDGFPWGKIYKRNIWNDIRFPERYNYEDAIIKSYVLPLSEKIVITNENLINYLVRCDSLSHRKDLNKRKNIELLDQYFMQEKIIELLNKRGMEITKGIYQNLLHELGTCLWLRTRFLDGEIVKNVFYLACDLCMKNRIYCKLDFEEKYIEKSLIEHNFIMWKLISIYSMINIKIRR